MWTRFSIALVLVGSVAYAAWGQVIYRLGSPNEGDLGRFGIAVDIGDPAPGNPLPLVAIGAENELSGMEDERTGRSYLFEGISGTLCLSLISPDGEQNGRFGSSVALVGDVDADAWNDIAVGAPEESPGKSPFGAGRAHVFSGKTGTLIYSLISPNEQFMGFFGSSVSGGGDLNGDGYADLLVAAPHEDVKPDFSSAGNVYILSGQTGFMLAGYVSPNIETGSLFGCALAKIGDIDDDGHDDIVVGAYGENPGTTPELNDAGRAYILSAQTGGSIHTLVSPNAESRGRFGFAVARVGDISGDGFDDVVVGAPHESTTSDDKEDGRAYLFSGKDGALLHFLEPPDEESGALFGYSVATAGDINGDGFDDVIIGSPLGDPDSESVDAGKAHTFCGRTGAFLYTISAPDPEYGGHFGHAVCGGLDINDDGFPDVLCGAPDETSASGKERAGHIYVLDGHLLGASPGDTPNATNLLFHGPSPNPVVDVRDIRLLASSESWVAAVFTLFNLCGRQIGQPITTQLYPEERTTIRWHKGAVVIPAGLYWWRLEAGDAVLWRPMTVLQ